MGISALGATSDGDTAPGPAGASVCWILALRYTAPMTLSFFRDVSCWFYKVRQSTEVARADHRAMAGDLAR